MDAVGTGRSLSPIKPTTRKSSGRSKKGNGGLKSPSAASVTGAAASVTGAPKRDGKLGVPPEISVDGDNSEFEDTFEQEEDE